MKKPAMLVFNGKKATVSHVVEHNNHTIRAYGINWEILDENQVEGDINLRYDDLTLDGELFFIERNLGQKLFDRIFDPAYNEITALEEEAEDRRIEALNQEYKEYFNLYE